MKSRTIGILTVLLIIIFLIAARIYYNTQQSFLDKKQEAIQLIKDTVSLTKVDKFYWFNTQETYYSLAGTDENGEAVYVIVSPDTKQITTLKQSQVVNEQDARSITVQDKNPKEVLEARLGMLNNEPVWEISYKMQNNALGYYYIAAKTGQWVKDVENI